MKHTFAQYTVDWVGVTGGASLTLAHKCALPAPFIVMDEIIFKGT
jgi:hypothetical protein